LRTENGFGKSPGVMSFKFPRLKYSSAKVMGEYANEGCDHGKEVALLASSGKKEGGGKGGAQRSVTGHPICK